MKDENAAEQTLNTGEAGHNHSHDGITNGNMKSLESLSLNELLEVNRNISARFRKDYRSWNYREPERWPELAESFSGSVISSCPETSSKKEEIEQLFLNNLRKRSEIINSDSKEKQRLMNQVNLEFKYNLTFLTGAEGFLKWDSFSRSQMTRFNQMRDSLNTIIALSERFRPN